MAVLPKQKKYNDKNIKRIPLDIQKSDHEIIKAEAEKQGETVNGYIKSAIWQRLDRDGVDTSKMKSQPQKDPDKTLEKTAKIR